MALRTGDGGPPALIAKLAELWDASPGQQPLAINELYSFSLASVEKVLLQIVYLTITLENDDNQQHLRRYLLSLASKSMVVGLKLSWAIDAAGPAFRAKGLGSRVDEFTDVIEASAVNRRVPHTKKLAHIASPVSLASIMELSCDDLLSETKRKESRVELFHDQRHLLAFLTAQSSALVKVADRTKRKAELHKRLEQLNTDFIHKKRVFFPLGESDDQVQWIVNVVIKECTVFSSRERAPYLVTFEVITDPDATLEDPSRSSILFPTQEALSYNREEGEDPSSPVSENKEASSPTMESPVVGEDLIQAVFGSTSEEKKTRIRAESKYGRHPGWGLKSVMVKAGDDLKQEELALQLISLFNTIWKDAGVTICVRPYTIMSTSPDAGVIELIKDASSLDGIKKASNTQSLHQYFTRAYGGENTHAFAAAQRNFIESMAGYSIICYLLQIKDRHNGNLMLSRDGYLVHIDFGFMLSTSPGGVNFERAPFKLSQELLDVIGGVGSASFQYFKTLIFQGMLAVRERHVEILTVLDLVTPYNILPCFGPDPVGCVNQVESRFRLDLRTEVEFALAVKELITVSVDNWRTKRYDQFQTFQNGII